MRTWTLAELDPLLREVPPPSPHRGTSRRDTDGQSGIHPEPLPSLLPPPIARCLAEAPGTDRSGQFYRLVMLAIEHSLTIGQTLTLAAQHAPGGEKYGRRLAGEVHAIWSKHDHHGQTCAAAEKMVHESGRLVPDLSRCNNASYVAVL